ncbi:hypothetical protein NVP1170O_195 [Vibrio phage 1.170.O._10N.261.52.C3]|nr:hypothetical protein NVP1170O_195 [Vibrio phage 1.170.O._10N.261.52.C3]
MGRWANNPHKVPFSKYDAIQKSKNLLEKGLDNLTPDDRITLEDILYWYGAVWISESGKFESQRKRKLEELLK